MEKICKLCNVPCIKKGFNKNIQRFFCKKCNHHFQQNYIYRHCTKENIESIIKLNNEGVGISGISRIIGISKSNVINKIKYIASKMNISVIKENKQEYEVDEMYTFINNKKNACYIIYAINRRTKQVMNFVVGKRTKENMNRIIESIKLLNPQKIYTDKLNTYSGLIEKSIHSTTQYRTNHIERFNLTLRTHLKRLARKTICYSKSLQMLASCLRIYFGMQG